MRYRLTGRARADVRALYRNGVLQFGETTAKRYITGLRDAFFRLAEFPNLGPKRDGFDRSFRTLTYGVHVILYRSEGEGEVVILRVRHGREDWQSDDDDPGDIP